MDSRGQLGMWLVFIFMAFTIIIIGAIMAPVGARFSAEMYAAGAELLNDTKYNPVAQIADADVRERLEATFDAAMATQEDNIEVSTGLYKYSWVILLVLTAIVLYLVTRSSIPYNRAV